MTGLIVFNCVSLSFLIASIVAVFKMENKSRFLFLVLGIVMESVGLGFLIYYLIN